MTDPRAAAGEDVALLAPGRRLGPYEVLALVGAGGMGEVYRARDPRLGRDVALKVVRRSLAVSPEHLERLASEGRVLGGLNHPNIVAVFDVGFEGDIPYVVCELLEGQALTQRLALGHLPYRKALDYGTQIAQALGAAHEKGICHRDVKPGNIFITTDGRAKLLDFGLAVPSRGEVEAGSEDSTVEDDRPARIGGTAGYMSPEQVLGHPVDGRTDVFALGVVLYQMLTGARAFRGANPVEAMAAILRDEPRDPLEVNPRLPAEAAALVRRCLEKNREERFQSARDLAFHLQQLLLALDRPPRPTPPLPRVLLLGLVALMLAVGATLAIEWLKPRPAPAFEQLTFRRGRIGGARFLPEGKGVVFSEAFAGDALEVWRLDLPSGLGSPRSLGYEGAEVLSARSGKVALSLGRRFVLGERFTGTLAEVPLDGGSPRELLENVDDADWDPGGDQLAVVVSKGVEGESRLEYPAGHLLHQTPGSIRFPRVSPDGRRIAFLVDPSGRGASGRVGVVNLDGDYRELTEPWTSARGLAWSTGGSEVWFAAARGRANRAVRAVDLARHERQVLDAPTSLTLWDVAPDGRVLLSRDEDRRAIVGVPPDATTERDFSWFDTSGLGGLSRDGRWLLFVDRFGVYLRSTDGAPPIHLGLKDGFADDLSPDGRTVLATTLSADQLLLLPRGAGDPQQLPADGVTAYHGARFFPDGRRVLFTGSEPGHSWRSYVQEIGGSPPHAITPEGTWGLSISPDAEWVAAIGSDRGITLWPVAGGPHRLVPGSGPEDRPGTWSADGWLWLFQRGHVPAEVSRLQIATGRREAWKKLVPPDAAGVYSIIQFAITPDGRSYFYGYTRQLSDLYVASHVE